MARRTFNAIGSTADIAFLLLCYFLMTTTMGDQSGLQRRLPPIPDAKTAQDQKVNRRNIIIVRINSADKLFAGSEAMDISLLRKDLQGLQGRYLPAERPWYQLPGLHRSPERTCEGRERTPRRILPCQLRQEVFPTHRRTAGYCEEGRTSEHLRGRA